jgi:hypothetical protein
MLNEHEVIDGLTRYYRDLDSSISVRPPDWNPQHRGAGRVGSWRMQLLATAALLLLIIGAGVLIHEARLLKQTNPATTPSPEVKAYQAMVASDLQHTRGASGAACNTTQDSNCLAAIAALTSAAQQWLDDLDRSQAPSRFAPVEAELRRNLTLLIGDLGTMRTAFTAHVQHQLDVARDKGAAVNTLLQDEGIDIVNAYQGTTAEYRASVRVQVSVLHGCGLCQVIISQRDAACTSDIQNCIVNVETTRTTVEEIQGAMVRIYAPDQLAGKEGRLHADLTSADAALVNMTAALNPSQTAGTPDLASAHNALVSALARFVSDANTI